MRADRVFPYAPEDRAVTDTLAALADPPPQRTNDCLKELPIASLNVAAIGSPSACPL